MIQAIQVREALPADAPALMALREVLARETESMLWEPGEYAATVADEEQRIVRMNGQPNSRCLVATDGGEVVGFLHAMGGQARRQRHATTLALGVRRSHWGRGVGGALLASALAWSRAAGLRRVELTVHTDNERAVALYRRHGFEVEGVRRCSLRVGGRCKDEYLMALLHAG